MDNLKRRLISCNMRAHGKLLIPSPRVQTLETIIGQSTRAASTGHTWEKISAFRLYNLTIKKSVTSPASILACSLYCSMASSRLASAIQTRFEGHRKSLHLAEYEWWSEGYAWKVFSETLKVFPESDPFELPVERLSNFTDVPPGRLCIKAA